MFALEKNNSYQISRGKTGKNMEKNKKNKVGVDKNHGQCKFYI